MAPRAPRAGTCQLDYQAFYCLQRPQSQVHMLGTRQCPCAAQSRFWGNRGPDVVICLFTAFRVAWQSLSSLLHCLLGNSDATRKIAQTSAWNIEGVFPSDLLKARALYSTHSFDTFQFHFFPSIQGSKPSPFQATLGNRNSWVSGCEFSN